MVTLSSSALIDLAMHAGLEEPSIVLDRLADSHRYDLAPTRTLYPASMIKTPLAAVAYVLAGRGEVPLGREVKVDPRNITANDKPSPLVPGYVSTVRELIHLAITRSDNVATNMLFDALGRARATEVAHHELGLHATAFHRKLSGSDPLIDDPEQTGRNAHPASDAAILFRLIATAAFAGADLLRTELEAQQWNGKLSAGLNEGDRFAHKTGDTSQVSHDGGILTTTEGGAFVLVVYTACGSSDEVDGRFAAFMRALRPLL